MNTDSTLRLVNLYPGFLGRYGHQGNALILAQRSRWRGSPCEIHEVSPGDPIPSQGDIYLLAGGDTRGVATVANLLKQEKGLLEAVRRGSVLMGIGSGLQLLGHTLVLHSGEEVKGMGLLDLQSAPVETRSYGPLVADPCLPIEGPLLGFEDHQMVIRLGTDTAPLAKVHHGEGNGGQQQTEGAWSKRICGTSLRGPVLTLNPGLADWLLSQMLGPVQSLPMLAVDRLRERFLRGLPRRCESKARR